MRTSSHPIRLKAGRPERLRHRWGVILAGGDGKRLLPFTSKLTGDDRPKQFCAIIGQKTLLEQTFDRVRRIVKPAHTLLALAKAHERFFPNLGSDPQCPQMLVQPYNRGTAPAIAYSLARLRELDPAGMVAVFPSDHHFADEALFTANMETAFEAAEVRPDRVILLGVTPDSPEGEYGWVEPGVPLGGRLPDSVCHVARFWEKPSRSRASTLMKSGWLWNSFVMVGKIDTFSNLTRRALPTLMGAFESIRPALFTAREGPAVNELYKDIPSRSFSDDVLSIQGRRDDPGSRTHFNQAVQRRKV